MICVKFTAFCDLRICLATHRKSVRKFWFGKLASTCTDLRVRLGSGLKKNYYFSSASQSKSHLTFKCMHHRKIIETVLKTTAKFLIIGRQNAKLAPFLYITSFFSGSSKSYIC